MGVEWVQSRRVDVTLCEIETYFFFILVCSGCNVFYVLDLFVVL